MVDFSLVWDLRLQGAQQAKADLDAYLQKMKEGQGTTQELETKTRAYDAALRQVPVTTSMARKEFALTHPELFQMTQAFTLVGRAASSFLGIINAFNLNNIRQLITGQTDVNNLLLKQSVLQEQIASFKQHGVAADDLRVATAQQELNTTNNDIIAAQAQAQTGFVTTIGTMVAGTLSAAGAISQLIQGWSKISALMSTIRGLSIATTLYTMLGSVATNPLFVAPAGVALGGAIGIELQAQQNNTDFFSQMNQDITTASSIGGNIINLMGSALGINFAQAAGIPKMAKGGIVTSPTVAMIGEGGPEAVMPLNQMGESSTTITMNIGGSISTLDDIANDVSRKIRENIGGLYR